MVIQLKSLTAYSILCFMDCHKICFTTPEFFFYSDIWYFHQIITSVKKIILYIVALAENVALNRQAEQLNPYTNPVKTPDYFDASNAVDGLKSDLRGLKGQCVLSAENKEIATWWVNLSSMMSIHHITIYYRTDNVKWGKLFTFTIIRCSVSKESLYCSHCLYFFDVNIVDNVGIPTSTMLNQYRVNIVDIPVILFT